MNKELSIYILATLIPVGMALPPQRTTFDPAADFSASKNPNSFWQYGYSATESLAPDQFRLDTYVDSSDPVAFWHPAASDNTRAGYYPYVAFNRTDQSRTDRTNGWAVRAGEIAMEASNSGQYSIVRFTVPETGAYQISAKFEGIHFHLSSTDVHVLHNSDSLFQADIDGFGGDPAFHPIQGSNPAASYSARVHLRANDTVSFAVGFGKNRTHFNDTTGLIARLVLLPASDRKK